MNTVIFLFQETTDFDRYIDLIEVLIWPFTILVIILLFRKNFNNAFNRLGSIDASATGISMTFNEVVTEGKALASKIKPLLLSKSAVKVHEDHGHHHSTPYEQVANIDHELKYTLNKLATERGLKTDDLGIVEIAEELEKIGELSYNHTNMIKKINQLIKLSNKNITQTQVNDIKQLQNSLIKSA